MRVTSVLLAGSLLTPCALAAESPAKLADSIISAPSEQADGPVQGYRAKRSSSATRTDTPISEIPQAISVVPAEQEANTVVTVLQKGYSIAERVLRPALVTVTAPK